MAIRGRCALCRCRARDQVYGIKVCTYHVTHGEDDRPCPYCLTSALFDPRWTYTVNGRIPGKLCEVRQVKMPNTIFLDSNGEAVLDVIAVREPAPRGWKERTRLSAVMIAVGLQMGTEFTITQWATNWEQSLFDAARPTLSLLQKVYVLSSRPVDVLAGDGYSQPPTWPTINLRGKMHNVRSILTKQQIEPHDRGHDIEPVAVGSMFAYSPTRREQVWRHNYLNVLDLAMRVFQVEWPAPTEEYTR